MDPINLPLPATFIYSDIAENLSPTGRSLRPFGDFVFEEFVDEYKKQVRVNKVSGFEFHNIEGMTSVSDARAAVLAVRETSDKPVFVTFVCDDHGRIPSDSDILAALTVMQGMGVSAFGIVCPLGSPSSLFNIERLSPYSHIPLIAALTSDKSPYDGFLHSAPADKLSEFIKNLAVSGVRIFGICRDVGKTHIDILSDAVAKIDLNTLPAVPMDESSMLCATGKEVRFIDATIDVSDEVECSPDMLEDILNAEDEPIGAIKINLQNEDDIIFFSENQYMITQPLCLTSESPELLEAALRVYNGRAFYDGTGYIEESILAKLADKYGLICL